MENIYKKYKHMIEHAIQAGIITEENKDFYLSAIEEENDSELSELESRLNMEDAINSGLNVKHKHKNIDLLKSAGIENNGKNKTIEIRASKNDDCQSLVSESTIENYSILDIKAPQLKDDFTGESDSDISSLKQEIPSASPKKSFRSVTKNMKNPSKSQLIDFNVPIYIDIKKKKVVVKPQDNLFTNSMQYEVLDVSNSQINSSKLLETGKEHNLCKWGLPKTKVSVLKRDKETPPINLNNSNSSSISTNRVDQSDESHANAFRKLEKLPKRKSAHTCLKPERKKGSELCKQNQKKILNNREDDGHEIACHNTNQKHTMNNSQKIVVPKGFANQKHRYKINLKQPVDTDDHQHSHDAKVETKLKMCSNKNKRICKRCNCNCVPKSIRLPLNSVETTSEGDASVLDFPMTNNCNGKDCERCLNLNIICHFYQDDDTKERDIAQNSKHRNISQDTTTGNQKNEISEECSLENTKSKRNNNKIQRFSKIFTNMKLRGKQKQPDCHL